MGKLFVSCGAVALNWVLEYIVTEKCAAYNVIGH